MSVDLRSFYCDEYMSVLYPAGVYVDARYLYISCSNHLNGINAFEQHF